MKLELLPEECISHILSCTSPRDACQSSSVSTIIRDAADSDMVWEKFLPPDYKEILSRLVSPVTYRSRKELFVKLFSPHLIDGGSKTVSIDMSTGKKVCMLSARELHITWSTNGLYWCWKPLLQSRFTEVAELVMVCWLEIDGKMNTGLLSPNTRYGAYLVVRIENRAFGLESLPLEVSVEIGNYKTQRTINLCHGECGIYRAPNTNVDRKVRSGVRSKGGKFESFRERGDGWLELELGEFYNDVESNKEVKMSLREVKGVHLKGGLVVEGIEGETRVATQMEHKSFSGLRWHPDTDHVHL